jgi:opacity protein-like surface antigen
MKRFIAVFAILLLAAVSSAAQYSRFELLRAEYGSGNNFVDVTPRIRSLVQGDTLSMRVDNETLGIDPSPGVRKTLRLRVRDQQGREQVLTYTEKESFSVNIRTRDRDRDYGDRDRPMPPPYSGGAGNYGAPTQPGYGGGLQILRADYGADNRFVNVTSRLASNVQGNALTLRITNGSMGGDPAEDHPKILNVWYTFNGRVGNARVNEKDTLNLPSESDFFAGNLRIMRAQYGVGRRYADVTDLLNSQIQGDQLNLRITNDTMGGDPDPEQRKQLTVFYIFNGRPSRVMVNEKSTLTLPGSDAYNPPNPGYSGGGYGDDRLQILHASYGAGDRRMDVTDLLNSQLRGSSLQLVVSNDSMGGDPAPGLEKRLRVIYLWQGMRSQITVGEGETLVIP